MRVRGERSGAGRRVLIIGAGPGGLCMGIRLKQAGFDDFVILEKGAGVGGTWYHNRYPGLACDVASHLYSFSFELKPDWPRPYSAQPEILASFEHCAAKYGLEPHLRLRTGVKSAFWDEECLVWRVLTEHGALLEADVVVSGMGMFNELSVPDIPGLEGFRGTVFHSARWRHDHDLTGERIGVIGSAASAVQFVPEIVQQAAQVYLYQRSANWVLPKADEPFAPEQIETFRRDPAAMRRLRLEIFRNLDAIQTFSDEQALRRSEEAGLKAIAQVHDPELRRKLTPTEPYGCKRPLLSNDYYPAFNRPNLELVTEPIDKLTADAIRTADGKERRIDTLVLATGFCTTRYTSAIEVIGRGGRELDDAWNEGAEAYLGITTSGFPNLFMLYGPNTNNGSILFMLECQAAYILRQLERMESEQITWMDVRPEVMARYNEALQRDLDAVEVWQAGCHGYYRSASGRIVTQWPHTMTEYHERTMRPDPEAYEVRHGAPRGGL